MKKALLKVLPVLLFALIIATANQVLDGLVSIRIMKVVDCVTTQNHTIFREEIAKLLIYAAILVPLGFLMAYGKGLYKKQAIVTLKKHYVQKIFNKDINQFQSENTAVYYSTLTNDLSNIEMNYIDGIYEVFMNISSFIVGIAIITYVSPWALLAGVIVGLVGALATIVVNKPLQKHQMKRSELYKDYTAYIKEFLSAFHIIKSNNIESKVKEEFERKSESIQDKGYHIDKIISYIGILQNFVMYTTMYGMVAMSVFLVLRGELTLGGVVLMLTALEKIMNPIMMIGDWLPKILSTKGLFAKIDSLLLNVENGVETTQIQSFGEQIEFEKVGFSYGENPVLKNVSLKIKKGEKYLIIGPSGGGKSTLLKLIRKYFEPSSGIIKMDHQDLNEITKQSYFKQLANIEQQVFVFEDTVRNNLCLYKPYSENEINEAIERAGLSDFVKSHPDGLDRMIYDNGKNISGGERSRLAIARGLLQQSSIIILDEAFSSLDHTVAKAIEKTLLSLKEVTVINVSHVVFDETKHRYDGVFVVKNQTVVH